MKVHCNGTLALTLSLSNPTASIFFRRRLLEQGFYFDPRWRCVGDAEWSRAVLAAKKRAAFLPFATSVYAVTGKNLSATRASDVEMMQWFRTSARWVQFLKWPVKVGNAIRRKILEPRTRFLDEVSYFVPGQAEARKTFRNVVLNTRWPLDLYSATPPPPHRDANQNTHWRALAKDPNTLEVRVEMRERLRHQLQTTNLDRIAYLTEAVRGKNVLDIGCVENDADHSTRNEWLHNHLRRTSSVCLGIDILEGEIRSLKDKGYNVLCHDITKSALDKKFDVIISGEIVEHIGNIDGLLSNCRKCLVPGGRLLLSTPYPWFIGVSFRHTVAGADFPGSLEHVAWYDPANFAELASRHGYEFECYSGIMPLPLEWSWKRRIFEKFAGAVRKGDVPFFTPLSGCRSILYELRNPTTAAA
jgi:2-polyprenyl-3-methyl-5-hydroxy-6-metoxy-1,4-benzoquinol methylase